MNDAFAGASVDHGHGILQCRVRGARLRLFVNGDPHPLYHGSHHGSKVSVAQRPFLTLPISFFSLLVIRHEPLSLYKFRNM